MRTTKLDKGIYTATMYVVIPHDKSYNIKHFDNKEHAELYALQLNDGGIVERQEIPQGIINKKERV